ncbi:MAG TPA: hypothetical protein VHE55_00910 [Fimbriimonadaceae bacterium]|nr:hypothetical protein [Fimbriimonadaceae bacterium]
MDIFLGGLAVIGMSRLKTETIVDSRHGLELRLNLDGRCVIDSLKVRGQEVLSSKGIAGGIKIGGAWYTTQSGISSPTLKTEGGQTVVSGIRFGKDRAEIEETWTFTPKMEGLEWTIDRRYPPGVTADDTACPMWSFASMSTWTGALLSTGGVAWCKLFDAKNASYAMHSDTATFWNASTGVGLEIRAPGSDLAMRFSRQPDDTVTLACENAGSALVPSQGLYRFHRDRQDVWKPVELPDGHLRTTYILRGFDYRKEFGRGELKGIDGDAVREIMNTIGRIGVIDDKIVGSNGWYSGYACLHEPWFALMAGAVDDPAYTRNLARSLDYQRDNAIQLDGMVKSRWAYFTGDSQPGTYDANGFYECQWGRLMDTQTSYAINVAETFDLNGDLNWIRGQKEACEKALAYLMKRDTNGNGLAEMAVDSHGARKSSDWLDVICASYENAFVNAQLYRALDLWKDIESLLGDRVKAAEFRAAAAKLKANFNKAIDSGGFWDPAHRWYVYWREKDGSVYGDNLTLPVNFMAIAYGLCDDPARRKAILDQTEAKMNEEKLFCWPVNIYPFTPDETGNQPFPTYENGDIFLAWAETGIRAYAKDEPEVAVKYLRNVLDRYNRDGLAFQRYLRKDQAGAGDDILANNCSAVVGLFRDIYGIQPKYNRLYVDPHMTAALAGTSVKYRLRGRDYTIRPGAWSRVESGGWSVEASGDFAVAIHEKSADYFLGDSATPSLSLTAAKPAQARIEEWSASKRRLSVHGLGAVALTFHGMKPGPYRVLVDGRSRTARVGADGRLRLTASGEMAVEVRPES